MSQIGHTDIALPKAISAKLAEVRAILRRYVMLQSLFSFISLVLVVFWLGGLVDYLPVTFGGSETPRWIRQSILIALGVTLLWGLLGWLIPRWFARIQDRSIALLIEKHHPELENELVTAVELHDHHQLNEEFNSVSNPAVHKQLLGRMVSSLSGRADSIDAKKLFDWTPLNVAGWASGLSVLATVVFALLMPDWFSHWTSRFLLRSDEPWPRVAELRADGVYIQLPAFTGQVATDRQLLPFQDGMIQLPTGADVVLQVAANSDGKQVPEVCTVFYSDSSGYSGRSNMRRIGTVEYGWQPFILDGPPLDGLSSDLELSVLGLDARLADLKINAVTPTLLTDLSLKLTYPRYLMASLTRARTETVPFRTGLKIPEGTDVTVLGSANTPLETLDYQISTSSPDETGSETVRRIQCNGNAIELGVGALREAAVLELRPIGEGGVPPDEVATYILAIQKDLVPELESKLVGIGNAVTANALLPITGTVTDDHGLARMEVELATTNVNDAATMIRQPIEIPDDTDFTAEVDLASLAEAGRLKLQAGDTLGIVVTAADYFDLGDESHEGQGQAKQLSIVTEDELLVLLDRQELELRQRFEQIINELNQLEDTLQLLTQPIVQQTTSLMSLHRQTTTTQKLVAKLSPTRAQDDEEVERAQRMRTLRSQQGVLQGDKSEQELAGVAAKILDLKMQLENNRIDSYDRQERLQTKVHQPLSELLNNEYTDLLSRLYEVRNTAQTMENPQAAATAKGQLQVVLGKLEEIKQNMLEIETFNEIVDLVRGLLEDQQELLEETEKTQKNRILDLLK
ncbi:MAG: hypothetical protein ACE361_11230 [Aureliella sp.]